MSLVDYTIAVRRRPEWRRVRLQPGLWLAWAVMIAALLVAIAPQWFTSANPLEGIPGAQRPRRRRTTGWVPTDSWGRDPVDAGGLRRGAFPVGGADRRRHRPGGGHHPWHLSPGRGRTRGDPPSCAWSMSPAGHPLPAAAAHGDYSAGFRHGKCGGGGWHRGLSPASRAWREQKWYACATAIASRRPGAAAATFSPSSGAIFCPTLAHCGALLSRQHAVRSRRCWPWRHPQLPRTAALRRRSQSGAPDRRRSQLPVNRLVADHLPRPRRGRRGPCRQSS